MCDFYLHCCKRIIIMRIGEIGIRHYFSKMAALCQIPIGIRHYFSKMAALCKIPIGILHYFSKMAALCEVTSDTALLFQDCGGSRKGISDFTHFLLSSSLRPIFIVMSYLLTL